jgi:hypothetical protein
MQYFVDTVHWAEADGVEMFYFAAFDEAWKVGAEGDVGAYWGLWDKDGDPSSDERAPQASRPDCPAPRQRHLLLRLPRRPEPRRASVYPSSNRSAKTCTCCARHWQLLRLYDCSLHAERVLQVIREDRLPLKVMLGAYLGAEMNNFGCPWGGTYAEEQLDANRRENEVELGRLVALARQHADHRVLGGGGQRVHRRLDRPHRAGAAHGRVRAPREGRRAPAGHLLRELRALAGTSCAPLVAELDFISVHTYPVWEYKHIHEALDYTKDNVDSVARLYPGKPVVITEAGWCTASNGRGMHAGHAVQELQAAYYRDLMDWSRAAGLLCFVFEAFDEPWKGSADPLEPEKHWGLFTVDRRPKLVMQRCLPSSRRPAGAA